MESPAPELLDITRVSARDPRLTSLCDEFICVVRDQLPPAPEAA